MRDEKEGRKKQVRDEKKGKKKQARSNYKAKQHSTPKEVTFLK